jgi:hypothetical protein
MKPLLVRHAGLAAAFVGGLAAAFYAGRAFIEARTTVTTRPASQTRIALRELGAASGDSLPIWDAVELDPFRKERAPAPVSYRLQSTNGDTATAVKPEIPVVVLLGTVTLSDGSGFALCQSGDESPRIVRLGQSIGGFTLLSVGQAKAIFAAADGQKSTMLVSKGGTP